MGATAQKTVQTKLKVITEKCTFLLVERRILESQTSKIFKTPDREKKTTVQTKTTTWPQNNLFVEISTIT